MSTATENAFVGVRFGEETNPTLCTSGAEIYAKGDSVIVELDAGPAFARVELSPMPVFKPCQKAGARKILRRAAAQDVAEQDRKLQNESTGKRFCQEKARQFNLEMKISRVDFALGCKEATVYFTAEARVDFRQLVRDFSQRFAARIKMVQVGARDEAGILGGVGVCGRTLCCSTWLKEFKPISVQMAKRQNLSLNPSKISGQCGRLLCCLAYEDEDYKQHGPLPTKPPGGAGGATAA